MTTSRLPHPDAQRPLRRTRGDLIATAVIAAVCAIALITAFFTAPIRKDSLSPAAEEIPDGGQLAVVPASLEESFTLPDTSPQARPLIIAGVIITYADGVITATTADGVTQWTYERDVDLCGMAKAWGKVVAVYRANNGCGDVVAIDAATGQYADTRSAIAPDDVQIFSSNDRVGILAPSRAELWRNDLVRTVEYGEVEAPQEADTQPHAGCTLTSALTRKELFAVTEKCTDGSWLRFQTTTPEDSRKPEMDESVSIPDGAYLVAIGQDSAAIFDPARKTVRSYDNQGSERASANVAANVAPANLLADAPSGVAAVETADLPHNMSYFDGANLMLLDPATLAVSTIYEGALGTGVAVGDRLLYPSAEGIAVANWEAEEVERVIPVDRGGYAGPVAVGSAGATIVEKRGSKVVVLTTH